MIEQTESTMTGQRLDADADPVRPDTAPRWARRRQIPAFFVTLATRRTWIELGYALISLGVGIAGFVFTVTTLAVSAGLAITFVGLPLLAASGVASRWLGGRWRQAIAATVGWQMATPPPFIRRPGLLGWIVSSLKDPVAWKSRLYWALKLPLGIASFVTAVVMYAASLGAITYWIWARYIPCGSYSATGACQSGPYAWVGYRVESPLSMVLFALEGVIVLLIAPWVVRAVLQVDKWCATGLLGASRRDAAAARMSELAQTRAHAVDDSAAMLRRIERDLHDGTQARLVALAMNVGLAKEKLAEGGDTAEAVALLDRAHTTAKDTITEVRDLARGIHPPVLDAGLGTALSTLASHSTIPVDLTTQITTRPAPAIETIAYFCVAELLTNATKHSGAQSIRVDARTPGGPAQGLTITVSDDGRGGAAPSGGTGLSGLAERVRTVDGSLTVTSPPGGPTVIIVELPLSA